MKIKTQERTTSRKNKTEVSTPIRPRLQENNKIKERLQESIQNNFVAQSQSLSTVSRTIAGVILGTIWVICYKENVVKIPNIWIAISIILSLAFFLVELLHYFIDSLFYHCKSDHIVKSKGDFNYEKIYNSVQDHSKCSFYFLIAKAITTFLLSVVFIVGIGYLYYNQ